MVAFLAQTFSVFVKIKLSICQIFGMFNWRRPRTKNSLTELINNEGDNVTVRDVLGNVDLAECVRNAVPELINFFVPDPEMASHDELKKAKKRLTELCDWAFTTKLFEEPDDFRLSRNASNILSSVCTGFLSKFVRNMEGPLVKSLKKFIDSRYSEDMECCGHFQRSVEALARETHGEIFKIWKEKNLFQMLLHRVGDLPLRGLCVTLISDYLDEMWTDPVTPLVEILEVSYEYLKKAAGKKGAKKERERGGDRPVRRRGDKVKKKRKVTNHNEVECSVRWRVHRDEYEKRALCALSVIKEAISMNDGVAEVARNPRFFEVLFRMGNECPEHLITLMSAIWKMAADLIYKRKTMPESLMKFIQKSAPPSIPELSEEWWRNRSTSPKPYRGNRLLYQFPIWGAHFMCQMHRCLFVEPAVSDSFGYYFVKIFRMLSDDDRVRVMSYADHSLLKGLKEHIQRPPTDEDYLDSETNVRTQLNGFLVELALFITDTEMNKGITDFMRTDEWTDWVIDVLMFYRRVTDEAERITNRSLFDSSSEDEYAMFG